MTESRGGQWTMTESRGGQRTMTGEQRRTEDHDWRAEEDRGS